MKLSFCWYALMGLPWGAIALLTLPAAAADVNSGGNSSDPMSQVTAVAQLSDVRPTDWAFQALQGLVERYGCVAGYPDKSYRGDRALTRYEFAAAMNACTDRVQELIAAATETNASKTDLETVTRLQQQFATELADLRGRVDGVAAKVATLESQQFSTTTKLYGQAVMGLQGTNRTKVDFFPRNGVAEREGQAQTNFGDNLQLSLATTFTGKDLLLTGLQTGNLASNAPELLTNMGRLGYESGAANQVSLSDLSYRFALTPNFGLLVGPIGVNPENTFRGINPLEGYGTGALSLFGQRNPIISLGNTNAGVGFDWQIADRVSLQGVYSAALADRPDAGLFDNRWTAGAQLSLAPTDQLNVGLNYLFSRSVDGVMNPGIGDAQLVSPFFPDAATFDTQAIGATAAWQVSPQWTIGTWGGWTRSRSDALSGTVATTNWMLFSAFPDLLRRGNLGGILVGQPPKITSSTLPDGANFPNFATGGQAGGQPDTSLHLEAFYRAQVNSQISVTPGLLIIFNPNHNKANDTLVQGVLRATYQF
jgi:Carbohydrate-selective porin, OprB family/S-layer homology domain